MTFRLHDDTVIAGPGDVVFAPRGVPHTFANLSDAPARQLIVCTPAGFERHFARFEQPIPEGTKVGPPLTEGV